MNAMPTEPDNSIGSAAGGVPVGPDHGGPGASRRARSTYSSREWLVLFTALAVAVLGTGAAALTPGRADASGDPIVAATTPGPARACAATGAVEPTGAASVSASSSIVASAAVANVTPPAETKRPAKAAAKRAPAKAPAPSPSLVTVGTVVDFGGYEGAPLRWRVLHADAEAVLLLSEYVVSAGAFRSEWEVANANRYGESEVRSWLQEDFLAAAFTSAQVDALLPQAGGAAAGDTVFLLSAAEVGRYLPSAARRKASPRAPAGADRVGFSGQPLSLSGAYAAWWLADAASDGFAARAVLADGRLGDRQVYYADLGVRPAIRVRRDRIAFALEIAGGE